MSLIALPLMPLAAAAAVVALRRRPTVAAIVAVAGLAATTVIGGWAALAQPDLTLAWSPALHLTLRVDAFGRLMVVLVPLIAAPIVAYAAATESEGRTRLVSLLLAFVAAMLLLVVAADFLSLLIAWELIGAVSWALIGHAWHEATTVAAGTRAFVTTRVGDIGLYVATGATFAASGSLAFSDLQGVGSPWIELVAGGVLLAATAKSAQLPFSPWLFAAMAGPTPVSALLHSATLVAAGAYLVVRLAPLLDSVAWFLPAVAGVGIATALAGSFVATLHDHAKRALAASTSAQYGLMFVAVGAGSTAAAAAHLVTHAAFKSLLFLAAGIATHATGTAVLGGRRLGRALPAVAAFSAVGALALAAVPPLGGAWSKDAIVAAAVEASPALGLATLAAGFLSALYAGRFQLLAFGPGKPDEPSVLRPPISQLAALAALASLTIGLAALWLPGVGGIVAAVTGGTIPSGTGWEPVVALALVVLAALSLVILERRGRLADLGIRTSVRASLADWLALPSLTDRIVAQPTLWLAAALVRFDDRVVDAGVRASARIGDFVSKLVSRRVEVSIDGLVRLVAELTLRSGTASRRVDDAGLDRTVEAAGLAVGRAGHDSRQLQTGLAHHYYVILAAGVGLIAFILALTR